MATLFIHSVWEGLLDWLLPSYCLGCGARGEELCRDCLGGLPLAAEPSARNVLALYDYQTPLVKALVWRLKYKGAKSIGRRLGQELHRRLKDRLKLTAGTTALVIPVPLHARRLAERGFNQSAVIAKAFAGAEPDRLVLTTDVLKKIKDTPTQVSIKSRAARLANLAGAFAVPNPNLVAGKTIILIDDVATTGGTLAEARRALRQAGAARVKALAIARG